MQVKDIMTTKVITIQPNTLVLDAIKLFKKHKINGCPVMKMGSIVGMVTESDILKFFDIHNYESTLLLPAPFDFIEAVINMKAEEAEMQREFERVKKGTVDTVMVKSVETISPETTVGEAADIMAQKNFNRLPVLDQTEKLVGIVTRHDLLKALVK